MTDAARHPAPGLRAVVLEQIRVVGLGLRREAALLTAALAFISVVMLLEVFKDGESIDFEPNGTLLIAAVGLLLPFGVWKGDKLFDGAHLWTLPVNRPRHALAKALAGGVWLLLATTAFLAWLLVVALLSGGDVGAEETRLLLVSPPPAEGPVGPEALKPVPWSTQTWQWIVPFTAGPVAYLLGSAFRLGLKHPLRWAAGLFLGFVAVMILGNELFPHNRLQGVLQAVVGGPYGIDAVLSGGSDTLTTEVTRPGGKDVAAWRELPTAERWAGATVFWALLGAAGLGAALFRHRER